MKRLICLILLSLLSSRTASAYEKGTLGFVLEIAEALPNMKEATGYTLRENHVGFILADLSLDCAGI
jgi:hypothetical protein